jgi:hypothetical protein
MASSDTELPNLGAIIGAVLQRVPREHAPLLIATAERLAAARYRGWATEVADPSQRTGLRACAAREEEIARRVESLFPGAESIQRTILSQNPDLEELNRSLFAGRPLTQQFTIQAQGERLGAATWRSFAAQTQDQRVRETLLGCAGLEEESAAFLESLL